MNQIFKNEYEEDLSVSIFNYLLDRTEIWQANLSAHIDPIKLIFKRSSNRNVTILPPSKG